MHAAPPPPGSPLPVTGDDDNAAWRAEMGAFGTGDVIVAEFDARAGTLFFSRNGGARRLAYLGLHTLAQPLHPARRRPRPHPAPLAL